MLQSDKIITLTNAAGVELEPIWATLLAKALEGKNVKDLLSNVGSGGGAPAVGGAPTAGGGGGAAAAEAPKEEEKKEEEKEESDDDMVRVNLTDSCALDTEGFRRALVFSINLPRYMLHLILPHLPFHVVSSLYDYGTLQNPKRTYRLSFSTTYCLVDITKATVSSPQGPARLLVPTVQQGRCAIYTCPLL